MTDSQQFQGASTYEFGLVVDLASGWEKWRSLIKETPDHPQWLKSATKWDSWSLLSFDAGEPCYSGELGFIWNEKQSQGILYDKYCDGAAALSTFTELSPQVVSKLATEYIKTEGWLNWLIIGEEVDIYSTSYLQKEQMLEILKAADKWTWEHSNHGKTPEEWIEKFYSES